MTRSPTSAASTSATTSGGRRRGDGGLGRDEVLSRFPYQLPVDVRADVGGHWSVLRTAGLAASCADGADRFDGPHRTVAVHLMPDDVPGRAPADFLTALLSGAPDTRPAQRVREQLPGGGLRYAFWTTPQDNGRPRHDFYGFTLHPSGSTAGIYCTHEYPADLAWAQEIWRSLNRTAATA
ncbi:hypothetical protein AB4039_37945 [Streptomyces sp. M-16]|uniref:hypothetical protein n=1 Tax=Streptomyces sp. M-16 TaxID=3233040 RepID=UPI003F9A8825